MNLRKSRGFTLIELMAVVIVIAVLIAILLPVLSHARKSAAISRLSANRANDVGEFAAAPAGYPAESRPVGAASPPPLAHVSSFDADIKLTPRLSVGTDQPESIYEAKFTAKIKATAGAGVAAGGREPH